MKKILFLLLSIIILLCGCTNQIQPQTTTTQIKTVKNQINVKSVWITYYELSQFTIDKSTEEFEKSIDTAFGELSTMGFNTVTVQVRPCADSFYMSNYFPSSKYCFGQQGSQMLYDPLRIMCTVADKYNLRIEAWINPYRVSQDDKIENLCETNIAKIWYNDKNTKSNVYVGNNQIHFNPASQDVIDLIVDGVCEIVKNYSIDAIHFDDYFYPTTEKDIDATEYKKYQSNGGKLSRSDWRRDNVSKMLKAVYEAIKSINSNVLFGVSPAGDVENNYSTLYADVKKWASEDGYIDYICPQIYFGFKNETQPFMFTTKKWISLTNKDLYIGLPLYKAGKPDKYASSSDKTAINEFVNNNNVISRQIIYLSKLSQINGFYIFSYSYLKDENCKQEVENILSVMQNNNQG